MGSLTLPATGMVYVDANTVIYTVERHPIYAPILESLWQAAQAATIEVVSSELLLLETLVGPLKNRNAALELAYEQALTRTELRLIPISQDILRQAAGLLATTKLRTPDALHVATALRAGCDLFITNDVGFRGAPKLPLVVLDDLRVP